MIFYKNIFDDENWDDEEFEYEHIEHDFSIYYSRYFDMKKSNRITEQGRKELESLKKYINISYGNNVKMT